MAGTQILKPLPTASHGYVLPGNWNQRPEPSIWILDTQMWNVGVLTSILTTRPHTNHQVILLCISAAKWYCLSFHHYYLSNLFLLYSSFWSHHCCHSRYTKPLLVFCFHWVFLCFLLCLRQTVVLLITASLFITHKECSEKNESLQNNQRTLAIGQS